LAVELGDFPEKKTIPGPSLVETDQMRHGLKSKAELNAEWARVVCEALNGVGISRDLK
jgi:hypothetical protein